MVNNIVPTITDVLFAKNFLKSRVRWTPAEVSPYLSDIAGGEVVVKWENMQLCGSFKIRGALYKMFSLSSEESERGVITSSSGNHAQGVATAAKMMGVRAVICVPGNCPETKKEAIRRRGGEWVDLKVIGKFYDEAEAEAKRISSEEGLVYISGYEDRHVISGQGTAGMEFLEDCPDLDILLVPISGGGLITGISLAAKALRPGIEIWGVHAEANPSWTRAWEVGRVESVEEEDTLADALSGAASQILYEHLRGVLAGVIQVSEEELEKAIALVHRKHHQVIEGAGATGVAALMSGKINPEGKKVGVFVSGGNIDEKTLVKILNKHSA